MPAEIVKDNRETKIVFTIRFDEYNYRDLQRLSPAPQNVLMRAKIEALGNPGRTRATHNGSNPAHGDAIRRGVAARSAEVFALALWVARVRRGCPTP